MVNAAKLFAVLIAWPILVVPDARSEASPNPYLGELERRQQTLKRLGRTPAGVVALRDLMSLWEWVPPEAVERVVQRARGRRNHPLVRSFALYIAVRIASRQGSLERAEALAQEAGFLRSWFLCGPFDNGDRQGHETIYPVERELDDLPSTQRRYRGKGQRVGWRRLPFLTTRPPIHVRSYLSPDQEVVAYLQTLVASNREQPAALRLGTPGSFKVFLNGREVAARVVSRPARADQDTVGLKLRKGVNRLVVKVAVAHGSFVVFARLTRPDGGTLTGVTSIDRIPAGAALGPQESGGATTSVDAWRWLADRLKRRPGDRALLEARARLMVEAALDEPGSRAMEEVLQRWIDSSPAVEAYLLMARIHSDPNERRRLLQAARRLAPRDPRPLLGLARLSLRGGRTLDGFRALEEVLRLEPGFLPGSLEQAETFRTAGLTSLAAQMLDSLLALHSRVDRVLMERANIALEQNDLVLAERLFKRHTERHRDDISSSRTLANLAVRRGDPGTALAHLDRAITAAPHQTFLRVERARLLAGRGTLDEAAAEYRRALQIDPRSVRVLKLLAQVHLRAGRMKAAWAAWRDALRIQPQDADLRRYMAFWDPKRGWGIAERHRVPVASIVRQARQAPLASGSPASVLLEATSTEVHDNGLSRTLHQRLVRVESRAGVKQAASYRIQLNPDRQVLHVRAARVHRRSGGLLHSSRQIEEDLNEPWAGLWYDVRVRVIHFAGLQPGDIVEIEYLLEDVAQDNLFADYFGALLFLREDLPVHRFHYTLVTPKGRTFHFRQPRLPGVKHRVEVKGERRIHRWTARDLPKVVMEPSMPGWSEVADYLHASTYASWGQVARWYWGLIRPQLRATATLVQTARQITGGARTELERIRSIHNYVAKSTRYVGLEFGIHSYKPYSAAQVLARKFGDCKDKAALMVTLLDQVGIRAEVVLVRTRRRGEVDKKPASLAPFDHAIVYVPKHGIYLDATAEFAGTRELPFQDQGVMALHIGEGAGGLRRTPVYPASENTIELTRHLRVRSDAKLSVRIHEERRITGQAAPRWRAIYQAADHRRARYERAWNAAVGGARVVKVQMPDLEALERQVRVTAELEVEGLVRREGPDRLSLALTPRARALVKSHARLSKRRHPLLLSYPYRRIETVRLSPPPGWRFAGVPRPIQARGGPFGHFSRSCQVVGQDLVMKQEIQIDPRRVEAGNYPGFRSFLQGIDRHAGERVYLVR